MLKNNPTLLYVHFDSCDGAGHGNGYGSAKHLAAVSAVDGLGTYSNRLAAQLDEFILTADILSAEDIAALKAYYTQ